MTEPRLLPPDELAAVRAMMESLHASGFLATNGNIMPLLAHIDAQAERLAAAEQMAAAGAALVEGYEGWHAPRAELAQCSEDECSQCRTMLALIQGWDAALAAYRASASQE